MTGVMYLPWFYDILQLVYIGRGEGGGEGEREGGEREGGREGGRREGGGREGRGREGGGREEGGRGEGGREVGRVKDNHVHVAGVMLLMYQP